MIMVSPIRSRSLISKFAEAISAGRLVEFAGAPAMGSGATGEPDRIAWFVSNAETAPPLKLKVWALADKTNTTPKHGYKIEAKLFNIPSTDLRLEES
jgi:hypothetical protein